MFGSVKNVELLGHKKINAKFESSNIGGSFILNLDLINRKNYNIQNGDLFHDESMYFSLWSTPFTQPMPEGYSTSIFLNLGALEHFSDNSAVSVLQVKGQTLHVNRIYDFLKIF